MCIRDRTYLCKIVRNLSLKLYYKKDAAKRNSRYTIAMQEIEACLSTPNTVEGQIEAKALARTVAVSYTHLDVYKRQLISNPNIASNNNITFVIPCFGYMTNIKPPFLKENRKWISCKRSHAVVGTVKQETSTASDGAKFADN